MEKIKIFILSSLLLVSYSSFSQTSRYISERASKNGEPFRNMVSGFTLNLEALTLTIIIEDSEEVISYDYKITGVFKRFESSGIKYLIQRESKDYEEMIIIDKESNLITIQNKDDTLVFKIKKEY